MVKYLTKEQKIDDPATWHSFQKITHKWDLCNKCGLGENAGCKVYFRGRLPCDVLFIGEAPGHSEDALGIPFIGPAGQTLNMMIEDVGFPFSYAIVNILGCIPLDIGTGKVCVPTNEEADECRPRLRALVEIAAPRCVVCLGKTATSHRPEFAIPVLDIYHPSYLRRGGSRKHKAWKSTIRSLQDFLQKNIGEDAPNGDTKKKSPAKRKTPKRKDWTGKPWEADDINQEDFGR